VANAAVFQSFPIARNRREMESKGYIGKQGVAIVNNREGRPQVCEKSKHSWRID